MKSELIKPAHLARKAVVYIRQSTPHQVVSNQESLRLQYALRQRAHELGWHEADIDVIDADLGLSGASVAQRSGFKELVGRVGLSEVGLILSIDVTRLARNCSDWYPLLDICGLRDCLIADRDGVYDPGSANGRLLLGLKGTISELELHTIRSRLTAGLLAKAERGELALTLPIGFIRDPSGVVTKDPDMAVQERLGLVFGMFLKFRTVAKVMRLLNDRGSRPSTPQQAWRFVLDASDDLFGGGDPEESCLRRRLRLWPHSNAYICARWCITGESAAANRGMANCREGPVSCLCRLADL